MPANKKPVEVTLDSLRASGFFPSDEALRTHLFEVAANDRRFDGARADFMAEAEAVFAEVKPLVVGFGKEAASIVKALDNRATFLTRWDALVDESDFDENDLLSLGDDALTSLVTTLRKPAAVKGDGLGAASDLDWSLLVGREPLLLAVDTYGKPAKPGMVGALQKGIPVYLITPSSSETEPGRITWFADGIVKHSPTLSPAVSTSGRARGGKGATLAVAHAVYSAYGLAGHTPDPRFVSEWRLVDNREIPSNLDGLSAAEARNVLGAATR